MNNLLPCPFCGGKSVLNKGKQYTAANLLHKSGDWIWRPQIGCKRCMFNRVGDSPEQLVHWWNKRSNK